MSKCKEKQKGITLIALVITIIVLLILAGVTIAMLTGENGILTQAKRAKIVTENKSAEEKVKLAVMAAKAQTEDASLDLEKLTTEVTTSYGGQVEGSEFPVTVIMDGKSFTVDENENIELKNEVKETFSEIATEDRIYVDKNGERAVIPKGFAVGTSETINNVEDGLVIQDNDGNQFVWIPANGYVGDGFYIGRFEAGSETERTEKTTTNTKPIVKRDKFSYNYVDYEEAKTLCESMYESLDSVDSAILSLNDMKKIVSFTEIEYDNDDYIKKNGNFFDSAFTVNRGKYAIINEGEYGPYTPYYEGDTGLYRDVNRFFSKQKNMKVIFTTGATDRNKVKNIFDICGNVMEWCNNGNVYQKSTQIGGCFTFRSFWCDGDDALVTTHYLFEPAIYTGFRPVLYINEGAYNF